MTEKVDSSNLTTIIGIDEEFQGELELEISNQEQNAPFYLTKVSQAPDGTASWNLGVSGEPSLTVMLTEL